MSAPKTAAKRARCRECGTRFTRRPNNPGQSFCTPACRKRAAKRGDAAKGPKTGSDQRKDASGSGHLGKETTEFPRVASEGGDGGPVDQAAARERAAQARKSERYARRRTLWRITDDRTCRGCGRTLMDPESGVVVARTGEGTAVVLGLLRCGKVWLCPVCSAKIRHARALEITRAAVDWIERGGTVLLVSLTARHAAGDQLADLMDALQGTRAGSAEDRRAAAAEVAAARAELESLREAVRGTVRAAVDSARLAAPKGQKRAAMTAAREAAREAAAGELAAAERRLAAAREAAAGTRRQAGAYQRLITGGTWAGRPDRGETGIRDRAGFVGMIRATEVTVGMGAGWHPHLHVLVFLGAETTGTGAAREITGVFEPGEEVLAEFEDHVRGVWTRALAQVSPGYRPSDDCEREDCPCGGKGHGVDVKRVETAQAAVDFGLYVAKTQDGKDVSLEIARGDLKAARAGNMAPFELLGRIGDLSGGVPEEEAAGHGSLEWCLARWREYEAATKGRRAIEWTRHLRALLGIEGDDSEEGDLDALFELDGAAELVAGARLEERAWHRITRAALDLEVESTVAAGREADVGALVESIGGRSGSVRVLSAAEVREAWEAVLVALATRREAAKARREAAAREAAEAAEAAAGGGS